MILEVKYRVTVKIKNKINLKEFIFEKDFKYKIENEKDYVYGNIHTISKGYILDLFKEETETYTKSNNITQNDITICSFYVSTYNDGLDIYFENEEEDSFTLFPALKVYVPDEKVVLIPPVLSSKIIDDNSIMWIWDNLDYPVCINDINNETIAQIPSGIGYYIEKNLKNNWTYSRYAYYFEKSNKSENSNVSINTTQKQNKDTTLRNFSITEKYEFDKKNLETLEERNKYFKSGVGDGLDLLVSKQLDDSFNEQYNLNVNIYSTESEVIQRYAQVNFDYYFKASAKRTIATREGSCTVKGTAYEIQEGHFRVYKYASKPVEFMYRFKVDLIYYVSNNGVYQRVTQEYTTVPRFDFLKSLVEYNKETKQAELKEIKAYKLSDKTVKEIVLNDLMITNPEIYKNMLSGMGYWITLRKVEDDYSFNIGGNRYSNSVHREFSDTKEGTVYLACENGTDLQLDSIPYLFGFAEAQLFHGEEIIYKQITSEEDDKNINPKDEAVFDLHCVSDPNYVYDGDRSNIKTIAEVVDKSKGMGVTIVGDKITINSKTTYYTPVLTYDFTDQDNYSNVVMRRVFEDIILNEKVIYNFRFEILDIKGEISVGKFANSWRQSKVKVGDIISVRGNYRDSFKLESEEHDKDIEVVNIIPDVLNGENYLKGIVNGVREDNVTLGKKDLVVRMPEFNFVKLKYFDIKYEAVVTTLKPENALVNVEFEYSNEPNAGYYNNCEVRFSSEYVKKFTEEREQLVSIEKFNNLSLNTLKEKYIRLKLNNPNIDGKNDFKKIKFKAFSDNNDVAVIGYTEDYDLTNVNNNSKIPITVSVKGVQNSTSQWSPRIHNGFYYLNQDEYYLYCNSRLQAKYYNDLETIKEFVSYLVQIELKNDKHVQNSYNFKLNKKNDFISNDDMFYFKDNKLFVKPVFQAEDYKEFKSTTYFSQHIIFNKKVDKIDSLSWDQVVPGNSRLDVYIRQYDENKDKWTSWVKIKQGEIPNLEFPTYAVQFRVDFVPVAITTMEDKEFIFNDFNDYEKYADKDLCKNVIYGGDYLTTSPRSKAGCYVTKVIDYGRESNIKCALHHMFEFESHVEMAFSSISEEAVKNSPIFRPLMKNETVRARWVRYKVFLAGDEDVYLFYIHSTVPVTRSFEPGFGKLKLKAKSNSDSVGFTLNRVYSFLLPYDTDGYLVTKNLKKDIIKDLKELNYDEYTLGDFNVSPITNDIKITLNNNGDGSMYIKSNSLRQRIVPTEFIVVEDSKVITSPLPKQFSPITIEDEYGVSYYNVPFFDDKNNNILDNTETFIIDKDYNNNKILLNYNEIDTRFLEVKINEKIIKDFEVYNNIIDLDKYCNNLLIKDKIEVSYRIKNSFIANYDIENNKVKIELNSEKPITKAIICYETEDKTNKIPINHLSLNPIYNSDFSGFIYIDDKFYSAKKIEIINNNKYLVGNTKEKCRMYCKITDKNGNAVSDEEVEIYARYGKIICDDNKSDINGVVGFTYISCNVSNNRTIKDYISASIIDGNYRDSTYIDNIFDKDGVK